MSDEIEGTLTDALTYAFFDGRRQGLIDAANVLYKRAVLLHETNQSAKTDELKAATKVGFVEACLCLKTVQNIHPSIDWQKLNLVIAS
jgi:hypothetical protein